MLLGWNTAYCLVDVISNNLDTLQVSTIKLPLSTAGIKSRRLQEICWINNDMILLSLLQQLATYPRQRCLYGETMLSCSCTRPFFIASPRGPFLVLTTIRPVRLSWTFIRPRSRREASARPIGCGSCRLQQAV